MAKITLSPIASSPDITNAVNAALQRLVTELNDKVLYRNNPSGEPNSMSNDVDMGGNHILNVGELDGSQITINGSPLYEVLENAVYQTIINPADPFEVHAGIERYVTTTVDVDNLHSSGWYYTVGIGSEHPAGNVPGWLIVFARGSEGVALEYTMQVFIPHNSDYKFYVRVKSTIAGTWSTWFDMSSGPALTAHEALTSTAHDIGTQITDVTNPLDGRLATLETDVPLIEGRVDVLEALDVAVDGRLDVLEREVYLSSVRNTDLTLSTTGQVVGCNTCLGNSNISVNPDGSITYPYSGKYIVSWIANVSVTVATTIYFWIEKWNSTLSQWEAVDYSGIIRDFPTTNEVEFSVTYLRVVEAGEIYRVMAAKSAAGSASLNSATLPNSVVMPSFRIDIRK